MEMVKMAIKNSYPREECSQIHIRDSIPIKFPSTQPNSFILHTINLHCKKLWSISSSFEGSSIYSIHFLQEIWPRLQILEAAASIGGIISFRLQTLDNSEEKNFLTIISDNTDLFCAG
jgi:hypothetical protein